MRTQQEQSVPLPPLQPSLVLTLLLGDNSPQVLFISFFLSLKCQPWGVGEVAHGQSACFASVSSGVPFHWACVAGTCNSNIPKAEMGAMGQAAYGRQLQVQQETPQ